MISKIKKIYWALCLLSTTLGPGDLPCLPNRTEFSLHALKSAVLACEIEARSFPWNSVCLM